MMLTQREKKVNRLVNSGNQRIDSRCFMICCLKSDSLFKVNFVNI